jgi:hypothetical protein
VARPRLRNVKFADTTVNGDQAIVRFKDVTSKVELPRIDGRWYISALP